MDDNRPGLHEPLVFTPLPDPMHDLKAQFKRQTNDELTMVPVEQHEAMVFEGTAHQPQVLPSGIYLTIGQGAFRDMPTPQAQAAIERALNLASIPTNEHDAKQTLNGVFISTPTFDRLLLARTEGGFAFAKVLAQVVRGQRALGGI